MKGSNGILRLTELSPGQSGCVVRLLRENGSGRHFMKLMAMGIYPGANLELLRRSPTYVFRSGYSQFAIDADLAHMVLIDIDEKGFQ